MGCSSAALSDDATDVDRNELPKVKRESGRTRQRRANAKRNHVLDSSVQRIAEGVATELHTSAPAHGLGAEASRPYVYPCTVQPMACLVLVPPSLSGSDMGLVGLNKLPVGAPGGRGGFTA